MQFATNMLLTFHDHATLYSTTASFKRFSLISTLDLELILSLKKNSPFVPPSSGSKGRYRQKRVKDLVIENLKGSGTFTNYSFSITELLEFLYASFERQQKASRISNFESNLVKRKRNVVVLNDTVPVSSSREARSREKN